MVQPPPIVGAVRAVADPVPPVAALRPEGCHRSTPGCDDDFARESLAIAPTVVDARAACAQPPPRHHRGDATEQGAGPVTESAVVPEPPVQHAVQLSPGVYYVSPSPSPANTSWRRDRRARLAGTFEGFAPPPFGRPFDPAFRYVRVGVRGSGAIEREVPGMPEGTRRTWIAFEFPAAEAFPEAFLAAAGPNVRSRNVPSSFLLPKLPTGGGAGSPGGTNGTNDDDGDVTFVTAVDLRRFIASREASRVSSLRALCGAMCCLAPVATNDYGIGYPPGWPHRLNGLGGGGGALGDHGHFGVVDRPCDEDPNVPSTGIGDVAACIGAADLAGGGGDGGGCGGGGCGGGGCGGE